MSKCLMIFTFLTRLLCGVNALNYVKIYAWLIRFFEFDHSKGYQQ